MALVARRRVERVSRIRFAGCRSDLIYFLSVVSGRPRSRDSRTILVPHSIFFCMHGALEERHLLNKSSNVIAGMFMPIFEGELGDS